MSDARPAVVLLSGGLDSATCLAVARDEGFAPYALTVAYGQRHACELDAARRVAERLGAVEHRVARVDLGDLAPSALTADVAVPKRDPVADEIPSTYVPARNTVLLSMALAWAEALGARDVFIGASAIDYSGYPDCRPAFIEAFESLANVATKAGVEGARFRIHAPLIALSKADTIARGIALGVDYADTWSCYDPTDDARPCGACESCRLRAAGFAEAGVPDPSIA